MDEYDYIFKLLIVGDAAVGKSSLLIRYVEDSYNEAYLSTIGVDFKINTVTIDDKIVKLQIWDTAGQERFRTITSSYYRGANTVIIAFDISRRETFDNVSIWMKEVEMYGNKDTKMVLVGTKCDLEDIRVVDTTEAEEFAVLHDMDYFEVSSKNPLKGDIDKIFHTIAKNLIQEKLTNLDKDNDKVVSLVNSDPVMETCC